MCLNIRASVSTARFDVSGIVNMTDVPAGAPGKQSTASASVSASATALDQRVLYESHAHAKKQQSSTSVSFSDLTVDDIGSLLDNH
jgi:hypothetical protein